MSLWLILDGYNIVAPIAGPGRRPTPDWLERERNQLLSRLRQHLPSHVRQRTCVVFDAANPPSGVTDRYTVDGIDVRFSVGYREADDLIEEIIRAHSAPKRLAVVSSDHRIQNSARQRGATVFDSQAWLDDLVDDRVGLAPSLRKRAGEGSGASQPAKPIEEVAPEAVEDWLREFGFDDEL